MRTFTWYLIEKIKALDKLDASVLQFFTWRCCRNRWTKNGRVNRLVGNGRERLRQWSDITTLMKVKVNSDMLVQRILDREQQTLFKV